MTNTTLTEPRSPSASAPNNSRGMFLPDVLAVTAAWRTDQILVTTMSASREWQKLPPHPLDLHFVPSAMGHAPVLGLGLAMARPEREVLVLNGDGCMLMSLGCLATITASGAKNLTLIVLENGVYEVTGHQKTAGTNQVDFLGFARASGWPTILSFDDVAEWAAFLPKLEALPGPRFIRWYTRTMPDFHITSPGPIVPRLQTLQAALNGAK